ncbi:hypothetical protein FHG87_022879 [Trinorchestia longiramus]|nr:hypothetical protein FHG87_022879 [Trinorchestia longiramus]
MVEEVQRSDIPGPCSTVYNSFSSAHFRLCRNDTGSASECPPRDTSAPQLPRPTLPPRRRSQPPPQPLLLPPLPIQWVVEEKLGFQRDFGIPSKVFECSCVTMIRGGQRVPTAGRLLALPPRRGPQPPSSRP